MKHFDANVLIAWHRADHPHHDAVRTWCDELASTDEPFGAADLAWTAFLRITTNPRVFPQPTPVDTAFAFKASVECMPGSIPVIPGDRHWQIVERICHQHRVTGNLINDAFLAGIAIENGADLVSMDADFSRFRELRWIDPLVD